MVETTLCGLLVMAIGTLVFLRPDWVWKATERWKSYAADEPSDLYVFSTKLGGAMFFLLGIAVMVLPFILH